MDSAEPRDPVELLLKRIALRSFSTSLIALWSGCVATDGAHELEETHATAAQVSVPDAGIADAAATPTAVTCGANRLALRVNQPVDFVELRTRDVKPLGATPQDGATASTNFRIIGQAGTACLTATGPECVERIKDIPSPKSWSCAKIQSAGTPPGRCIERALVTTHGDEVRYWSGRSDLLGLLAPIDTLDEAILLLFDAGYDVLCWNAMPVVTADGIEVNAVDLASGTGCTSYPASYRARVSPAGELTLTKVGWSGPTTGCSGRRPAALTVQSSSRGATALGRYLGEIAELEDASVTAFETLARELEAHGAPAELIARAHAARDDEVRHAQAMSALARARGGCPMAASLAPSDIRGMEEMAVENAVEGCVRETYGALLGAHQAQFAEDWSLRRAMHHIADDEARHAALSHAVHAWIMPRLDDAARARVHAAQRAAISELARDGLPNLDESTRLAAGLPDHLCGRALVAELSSTLWESALLA